MSFFSQEPNHKSQCDYKSTDLGGRRHEQFPHSSPFSFHSSRLQNMSKQKHVLSDGGKGGWTKEEIANEALKLVSTEKYIKGGPISFKS